MRGLDEELSISREDLDLFLDFSQESDFSRSAKIIDVSPIRLYQFLTEEWPSLREEKIFTVTRIDNPILSVIFRYCEYGRKKTIEYCDNVILQMNWRSPNLNAVSKKISQILSNYEIVYLPTYRRVELALGDPSEGPRSRKPRRKFAVSASGLFTGDIQFGLADISDRLSELNDRIVTESNSGYRQISANIINELIDGSYERETDINRDIPSFFPDLIDIRGWDPTPYLIKTWIRYTTMMRFLNNQENF
jgi:hypothetical protein